MAFEFSSFNPAFDQAQKRAKYESMSTSGIEGFNRLQLGKEIGIPVGADSPMAYSRPSGRSYMDRERMNERYARQDDRARRMALANAQWGGGGRGYSGGGGGQPTSLMDQINSASPYAKPIQSWRDFVTRPRYTSANARDLATVYSQQNPRAGMEQAQSAARIMTGQGTVNDYAVTNPNQNPEVAQAAARIRFNQQRGLMGSMERALFG